MGNRANIALKTDDSGNMIVLYQHWAPEKLFLQYARALRAAKPRWSDPHYGARIFMSQIIGNAWNEETGFGISVNTILDNEHHVVVVDFTKQEVHLLPGTDLKAEPTVSWSFDKFVSKYGHVGDYSSLV